MKEVIKVVGLSTSPRREGNTAMLLERALEGALSMGASVLRIDTAQLEINPCRACNACFKTGKCVQDDDMQEIYPLLETHGIIILAAPIFSMGICAQGKALIDRLQCFWARKSILKKEIVSKDLRDLRRGLWISTAGSNRSRVFEGAFPTVSYFFAMLDIRSFERLLFRGVDEKGAIRDVPGALEQAEEMGRKLAGEFKDF
ncbi:MAG: flavodoxin family protein [Actinomycetota bacterium]|nr:flavodoxin family protein [Actinomycetota bacterium]